VAHGPFTANATVRWVSRWDAFPFHPLLVRNLNSAANDNGSDHGLPVGSAMDHLPRAPPRSASMDALHVRLNGFLSYLWQPRRSRPLPQHCAERRWKSIANGVSRLGSARTHRYYCGMRSRELCCHVTVSVDAGAGSRRDIKRCGGNARTRKFSGHRETACFARDGGKDAEQVVEETLGGTPPHARDAKVI